MLYGGFIIRVFSKSKCRDSGKFFLILAMYSASQSSLRVIQSNCFIRCCFSRPLCSGNMKNGGNNDVFLSIDGYLSGTERIPELDFNFDENSDDSPSCSQDPVIDSCSGSKGTNFENGFFRARRSFIEQARMDAKIALGILRQDGPDFDVKASLDDSEIRVSGRVVREVLLGILKNINYTDKTRSAKMGYTFFIWSSQQEENYIHTANAYHLLMKIFAECEEYKAMWRLLDEMTERGYPTTAYTFNILICTCGEAGLARKTIERFIKSKTFNFRPFKHSFNAILYSLLTVNQYRLIEWVYQEMIVQHHEPDVLTYNILLRAKYRLGKLDEFHQVLDEMGRNGFAPDLHTFNILLHILGKSDKPLAALNLLNHMREVGVEPSVLHFTTLIDGLSRAGNLEGCKYFFDEMDKHGCQPDVVTYTVMITGYIVAGDLDKAKGMFNEMIINGRIPNVFTYNSMIRGFCMAGKFEEACSMLEEMETKGCNPNFLVYSTLVSYLRNAGKLSKAHQVIRKMVEKGQYVHLISKFKAYRRC